MNKKKCSNTAKARLCIQYDSHSRAMCSVFCSLLENQSLVDLAICCGNRTIHAHKCIMAAGSPYFREQLEKNPGTQQVIINGLHFTCLKSIIEFIYCGETVILEENIKYVVAAANMFQVHVLRALVSDENSAPGASLVYIPPPVFLNKKPKYSNTFVPISPTNQSVLPNQPINETIAPNQASYQDNVASSSTFRVGKRTKESQGGEHIGEVEGFPMQAVNYGNIGTSMMAAPFPDLDQNVSNVAAMPFAISNAGMKTVDKNVFDQGMHQHMELMYQMPESEYVQVANDVLRSIPNDTMQFGTIAENGQESEAMQLNDNSISKAEDKNTRRKFAGSFNSPYGDDAGASTSVDLDAIFFNLRGPDDEHTGNDNVENTIDDNVQTFDHEHADILSEISSMQYYDNSVYEDVAERVEMAFQRQQLLPQQEVVSDEGKLPDLG